MKLEDKKTLLNVIFFIIVILLLFSCEKEPITQTPTVEVETTNWQDQYSSGGTVPDWTNSTNNNNELVGTNWVLTKILTGFGSTTMSDTLHFITNTQYYINSDSTNIALYSLYTSQNNVTLTFKPFIPMNYIQCSTNQLGVGFSNGQAIIVVDFVNLYNTVSTFRAWFTKI